jgi:uncharacterized protein DUF6448
MKTLALIAVLAALLVQPGTALAHCDAVDGPVATAARKALETRNVYLVLPYAPAESEAELTAAFEQALVVGEKGAEAKALADRYFMETAVRLHRAGEKAPYTGLKPAGQDFGPAIPAAEAALASGAIEPLKTLISRHAGHELDAHFSHAAEHRSAPKAPTSWDAVRAARQRISAELAFIGYVEALYRAASGGAHAE